MIIRSDKGNLAGGSISDDFGGAFESDLRSSSINPTVTERDQENIRARELVLDRGYGRISKGLRSIDIVARSRASSMRSATLFGGHVYMNLLGNVDARNLDEKVEFIALNLGIYDYILRMDRSATAYSQFLLLTVELFDRVIDGLPLYDDYLSKTLRISKNVMKTFFNEVENV